MGDARTTVQSVQGPLRSVGGDGDGVGDDVNYTTRIKKSCVCIDI